MTEQIVNVWNNFFNSEIILTVGTKRHDYLKLVKIDNIYSVTKMDIVGIRLGCLGVIRLNKATCLILKNGFSNC